MIIAALLISSTLVIVVEFFYIQKLKTVNHYINSDLEKLSNENVYLTEENENLKIENTRYETNLKNEIGKNDNLEILIQKLQDELLTKFKNISSDITTANNKAFLDMAKESREKYQNAAKHEFELKEQSIKNIISPINESLKLFNDKINVIEKDRTTTYESLKEQVTNLLAAQKELKTETTNLVGALKSPYIRGKLGEIQLRRLLEISGIIPYC